MKAKITKSSTRIEVADLTDSQLDKFQEAWNQQVEIQLEGRRFIVKDFEIVCLPEQNIVNIELVEVFQ